MVLKEATDFYPEPCYACGEFGCPYNYNIVDGYFTVGRGTHIDRDKDYWLNCPHDGLPMYIEAFEPRSKPVWRCAQAGCIGGPATEGSFNQTDSMP
jgi:hypothetical protein